MFACNNFLSRAFVTMICWTSTEVLLNRFAPVDSVVPSLDSKSLPELYFLHSIQVFLLLILRESTWLMALIPLALHSFLLSFAQFLQKVS